MKLILEIDIEMLDTQKLRQRIEPLARQAYGESYEVSEQSASQLLGEAIVGCAMGTEPRQMGYRINGWSVQECDRGIA